MGKNILRTILKTDQTVFSLKELSLTFSTSDNAILKSKLHYYVKNGYLYAIRRGLYARDKEYNSFELATKILTPSYISFETVLSSAGIIFQYYSQIFVATYQTRDILCDGKTFSFKMLKSAILLNSAGIENYTYYSIASIERAFLDVMYLHKEYHFDNLEPLDWDKVYELLPLYNNKSMEKRVAQYHEHFKKNKEQES